MGTTPDDNNNNNSEAAPLASNRTELSPISSVNTKNVSVATLTPIDGDLSYTRKLPKLPAITNTNHS